jgi:hypothetical protein
MKLGFFHILLLALLIILLYKIVQLKRKTEGFTAEATAEATTEATTEAKDDTLKRPYVHFYDNNGNKLNIVGISKPFSVDKEFEDYTNNKDKLIFIGLSSYLEFPNPVSNPFENFDENYKKYKYKEICRAWLHGFRNPMDYFPPGVPESLISESDYADCSLLKPDPAVEKKYDFLYICLKQDEKKDLCEDWATYNKNWELAKKCLHVMCEQFKLKGLLIGRKNCDFSDKCHELMETTDMLDYEELKKRYKQSRFIFIPNYADASPRVLTEALCHDIPCLVNQKILGGWKYVNEKTGVFFKDETDIIHSIAKMNEGLNGKTFTPRQYFLENYGIYKTGKRLKEFLYNTFPGEINIPKEKVNYVSIDYPKNNITQCAS